MTSAETVELPRTGGPGTGLGDHWRVIVLNDDHNTFEGVAQALSQVLPGVELRRGHRPWRNTIHNQGRAIVVERCARDRGALLGAAKGRRAHDGSAGAELGRSSCALPESTISQKVGSSGTGSV